MGKIESIAENLFFPEGPRWNQRDSKLYFSDILSSKVSRINEAGHVETVFEPGEFTSGLGFIENGDLLVVATSSQEILRIRFLQLMFSLILEKPHFTMVFNHQAQ